MFPTMRIYNDIGFNDTIDQIFTITNFQNIGATNKFTIGKITNTLINSGSRNIGLKNQDLAFSFTPTLSIAQGLISLSFPAWYSVSGVDSNIKIIELTDSSNC